jgi:AraC-like DNA-binding protein
VLPDDFANPTARVPRAAVIEVLHACAVMTGDPLLGLRAGASSDSGDGDLVEAAARACQNVGEALECLRRHFRLLSDETDVVLVRDSAGTSCEFHPLFSVHDQPIANDFMVASLVAFLRRNVVGFAGPLEVCLAHERPVYASEYARAFQDTRIIFDASHNAVVLSREHLAAPMIHANAAVARAFDARASELVERLRCAAPTSRRVREQIAKSLGDGAANMKVTAERLAMSEATLRRRLQDEGTTFANVLGAVRRELALNYLQEPSNRLSDIATKLGYGSATAFDRAFRRWMGATPSRYRDERRGAETPPSEGQHVHRVAS